MIAYIDSIGLQAPGLEGWHDSQGILQNKQAYQYAPLSPYSPQFLPANERRRTTPTIKLALRTAEETVKGYSAEEVALLPTLFACVDGDTQISAKMTHEILQNEPMISPIHFHNSVHNAPAGYWMIGQSNQNAASAISAGAFQIANTLIESMTQLSDETPQVLTVFYDLPIDPIIESYQPEMTELGLGLVLNQTCSTKSQAKMEFTIVEKPSRVEKHPWFGNNAAAAFLPVLVAIAQRQTRQFTFPISKTLSAEIWITPI